MEPPIKQIVLPPSKDGYYRFGELLGLIADAEYPSDDHPHGYLTKVVIWRPRGTRTGQYFQCVPPEGARLTDFARWDEWTMTRIYADRVRRNRTRSTAVDSAQDKEEDGNGKRKKRPEPLERIYWAYDRRLIQKLSKSQQRFWPDGSLVVGIEINDEATGNAWNWAMEQDWYEARLTAAAQLSPGDPGRLQVVDENRNEIEFRNGPLLKQGYIHISWLNAWGAIQQPVMVFHKSLGKTTEPTDASEPRPLLPWKMEVQAIAAELWTTLRNAGANPTVGGIADEVAKRCAERGIKTTIGVNPSANYLRSHVLNAKHWTPPSDDRRS